MNTRTFALLAALLACSRWVPASPAGRRLRGQSVRG